MIKRYYYMFNCNQNNHSYQKSIKYYLWLQRQQTNNISIAISFGFHRRTDNTMVKTKRTNNDLQNITQKIKD